MVWINRTGIILEILGILLASPEIVGEGRLINLESKIETWVPSIQTLSLSSLLNLGWFVKADDSRKSYRRREYRDLIFTGLTVMILFGLLIYLDLRFDMGLGIRSGDLPLVLLQGIVVIIAGTLVLMFIVRVFPEYFFYGL
jgi:hypothetical protein